ncbi:MAG: hypothetical protein O3A00_01550 [Planctomycetota bacterium]|nr:hypothetical protein [Planctomycetota bacterium]
MPVQEINDAPHTVCNEQLDAKLENDCVHFLSFLEQQIECLDANQGSILGCIQIVGEMLAECIEFTNVILDGGLAVYETVLAERLCEQIDRFRRDQRRNWFGRILNGKKTQRVARETYADISRQFLKMLASILDRAERQFRQPATAAEWADSFDVLTSELSQRW